MEQILSRSVVRLPKYVSMDIYGWLSGFHLFFFVFIGLTSVLSAQVNDDSLIFIDDQKCNNELLFRQLYHWSTIAVDDEAIFSNGSYRVCSDFFKLEHVRYVEHGKSYNIVFSASVSSIEIIDTSGVEWICRYQWDRYRCSSSNMLVVDTVGRYEIRVGRTSIVEAKLRKRRESYLLISSGRCLRVDVKCKNGLKYYRSLLRDEPFILLFMGRSNFVDVDLNCTSLQYIEL